MKVLSFGCLLSWPAYNGQNESNHKAKENLIWDAFLDDVEVRKAKNILISVRFHSAPEFKHLYQAGNGHNSKPTNWSSTVATELEIGHGRYYLYSFCYLEITQ